jgi:hypothetical protein
MSTSYIKSTRDLIDRYRSIPIDPKNPKKRSEEEEQLRNLLLREPGIGPGWMTNGTEFNDIINYLPMPPDQKAVFMSWDDGLRKQYLKSYVNRVAPREYDDFLNNEAERQVEELKKKPKTAKLFVFREGGPESDELLRQATIFRERNPANLDAPWEVLQAMGYNPDDIANSLERHAANLKKIGRSKPRRRGRGDEGDDAELAKIFGQMHLPGPAPVERPPAPAPAPRRQVGRNMFEPPPRQRAAPAPVVRRPRQVGKKSTREGESLGRGKVCRKCGGIKI